MARQRKIPFGYEFKNGEARLCPTEADAVRGIFHRYLQGASYARIAEEMSLGNIPYHPDTPKWNKNMVKRILENNKYLGADLYPRLVSDEDFLAVQMQKRDNSVYAPYPADLIPVRERAVCAVCGSRMVRDVKSHGRPRWACSNLDCGAVIHIDDDTLLALVTDRLRQLANAPDLIALHPEFSISPSMDVIRIQNELNICFNRMDINPGYMKTLIFAAAGEQYAALPDPTPAHQVEAIQERLKGCPATDAALWEDLANAIKHICIGGQECIELELTNGAVIGKETVT